MRWDSTTRRNRNYRARCVAPDSTCGVLFSAVVVSLLPFESAIVCTCLSGTRHRRVSRRVWCVPPVSTRRARPRRVLRASQGRTRRRRDRAAAPPVPWGSTTALVPLLDAALVPAGSTSRVLQSSFCTAIVSDVAEGKFIHFRADSEALADAARMCRVCVRYSTATAASSCVVCVAGQYSPGGISPCAACSAGYYSSSSGTAVCSACAAGRFAATAGLATCATCTGGQYVRFDSRVPGDYCPTPCSSC